MSITKAIGENLKDSIDYYRGEAAHYTRVADRLSKAWAEWDIDALREGGYITEAEAQQLRQERDSEK